VENYIYVGANVAETLLCDIEVHRKTRSASSLLGFLRPRAFGPHTTAVIVKKTVYESMVLGVLLHGSECWILTSKLLNYLRIFTIERHARWTLSPSITPESTAFLPRLSCTAWDSAPCKITRMSAH
jgi:hypothetical protein